MPSSSPYPALSLPLELSKTYTVSKGLGEGGNGIVYVLQHRTSKTLVACKVSPYLGGDDTVEKRDLVQEAKFLSEVQHPNVVKYHTHYDDRAEKRHFLIMELCSGGDLFSLMERYNGQGKQMPERRVCSILAQTARALHHLHTEHAIVHRDLKLENVIQAGTSAVKIIDLGESTCLKAGSLATAVVGTPCYHAPEMLKEQPYGAKVDMWSLGVIAYELMAGRKPFDEVDDVAAEQILAPDYQPPTLPPGYSPAMQAIVNDLLCINPDVRLTAAELLLRSGIQFEGFVIDINAKAHRLTALEKSLVEQRGTLVKEKAAFASDQKVKEEEWAQRVAEAQERERQKELEWKQRELDREREWAEKLAALSLGDGNRPIIPLKRRASSGDLAIPADEKQKKGRIELGRSESWWPLPKIWKKD